MAYSMNESFADNMVGKTVKYDVQPYYRGEGVLTKVTPRIIKTSQYMLPYGRVEMTYECFDCEILVSAGSSTGALLAGVPLPGTIHDTKGKTETLIGVGYNQLWQAVDKGQTIVIARCG